MSLFDSWVQVDVASVAGESVPHRLRAAEQAVSDLERSLVHDVRSFRGITTQKNNWPSIRDGLVNQIYSVDGKIYFHRSGGRIGIGTTAT